MTLTGFLEREPINLQGGWPTPRLHPIEAMHAAAAEMFTRADSQELLKYGPEWGDASLRSNIGSWLNESYNPSAGSIGPERVLVTNGASNGLATILQKFADPGVTRAVWMVEPTYFLACPVFRDAGFVGRIRGVPEGTDGVNLQYLEEALREVDRQTETASKPTERKTAKTGYPKIYRHILYMVPTFSNPSGKTMSLAARERLLGIAREHDVLLITDDVYDVLRWQGQGCDEPVTKTPPPPRFVDLDRKIKGQSLFGNAVSNGSFSKVVAPGTRVGWLEGTMDFISAMGTVGATVSGGCQGHFGSLVVNEMLKSGDISRHLEQVLIPTYRRRSFSMMKAIRELLYPFGVRILGYDGTFNGQPNEQIDSSSGGFFLYITFPDDGSLPSALTIAETALRDFNLRIAHGNLFSVTDDPVEASPRSDRYVSGARLCWAWHEEDVLVEGIERLAEVLGRLSQKSTFN